MDSAAKSLGRRASGKRASGKEPWAKSLGKRASGKEPWAKSSGFPMCDTNEIVRFAPNLKAWMNPLINLVDMRT
jgi:hypothetical protein